MTATPTPTPGFAPVSLATGYGPSGFDALRPRDLFHDEVQQRRETGYLTDDVVRRANDTDPDDRAAVLALVDELAHSERAPGWAFDEPDGLAEIRDRLDELPAAVPVPEPALQDRIHGGWLGRIAGCNLGKPVELGAHWTVEHIRDYLELAGAYPLTDYFPVLDPMPERFELRDNWPETTRGRVHGSARDDDIDYPILALHLLETHGAALRPEHVGAAWTSLFPLRQVYTAERAAYVNLTNGLTGPEVARYRNPYREWIGAQIRGDVFGYVLAGDPWAAAALAHQDATLSHVGNGVYGEMWAAALVSAAFVAESPRQAVTQALQVVPPGSRLFAAVQHVLDLHAEGVGWDDALSRIRASYGHYAWVHTVNNAAVVVAGLLWSDGDYTTAVGRTVMSGWDTDSNGATVGSVMGVLVGTAGLPDHFVAPLQDRTRSALFGFDNSSISDLAGRTHRLAVAGLS
jgi:ADP-ribosylglycohydrolase